MEKNKKFKYSWFRDQKMLGTILLIAVGIIQIFAFLKVPFISSIHGYTFGMLVGFYNPLIYIYIAYMALIMIFGEKIKLPKWVKFNKTSYWFLVVSIIFIGVSSSYYQVKTSGFTDIGLKPWRSFNTWFDDFTSTTAWAPVNTNGGILGAFLYSFFAMISSGIGALIISIVLLIVVISFIATGSFFGLYRQVKVKRVLDLKQKEVETKNEDSIDNFIHDIGSKNKIFSKSTLLPSKSNRLESPKTIEIKKDDKKEIQNIDNELPFDDTF